MEFDINKVYTAVNADELPIGSKCIFADTLGALENAVNDKQSAYVSKLQQTLGKKKMSRFVCGNHSEHLLAYLLKEPEYKPFSSVEKAIEAIQKHGGWIKRKEGETQLLVIGFTVDGIFLGNNYLYNFRSVFFEFIFVDDGSPCGELAE